MRSFTVTKAKKGDTHYRNLGGRYMSETPSGAARKAMSQLCRHHKVKGVCSMLITIRETTQNSAHKDYVYRVRRIKDPVTVERDGVEVTYQYSSKVKAA